jgi:DNA-binding transcriptional LysR family regulator
MKTGSVTEAAQVMHTTQPNASKSLKQLEEFAGVRLFERIAGRLRPTPEAELLFCPCGTAYGRVDVVRESISRPDRNGTRLRQHWHTVRPSAPR